MIHQQTIGCHTNSLFLDPAFKEALAESARGLVSVAGGQDSKDSWIPFTDRLEVFRKSSRQRIRPIQTEKTGPDTTATTAQSRRRCPVSETPSFGDDDTAALRIERGQRQAGEIVLLIDAVSKASENYPDAYNAEAEFNPSGANRSAEECALSAYATSTGALLDSIEFFNRWRDSGANGDSAGKLRNSRPVTA